MAELLLRYFEMLLHEDKWAVGEYLHLKYFQSKNKNIDKLTVDA